MKFHPERRVYPSNISPKFDIQWLSRTHIMIFQSPVVPTSFRNDLANAFLSWLRPKILVVWTWKFTQLKPMVLAKSTILLGPFGDSKPWTRLRKISACYTVHINPDLSGPCLPCWPIDYNLVIFLPKLLRVRAYGFKT